MKRWLYLISIGVAGGLVFRSLFFEGIYVASPSMEPALPVGTHYFLDKITLKLRLPRRGEIVVISSPINENIDLIKRVIGLPGETIFIKDKKVYINDQLLQEPYARYKRKDEVLVGDNIPPMKIPEDSFFVMGDNRDESGDSSSWKDTHSGAPIFFIKRKEIKGRLLNPLE